MNRLFPDANTYQSLLHRGIKQTHEASVTYAPAFHWSERHLQCLWFDARLRPDTLTLPNGETVTILDPGTWNLEAGPDFHNATLLVQPGERHLCGDIEVHVRPSDWDAHAHSQDPAYQNVILHVTWFSGPQPRTLPQHLLSLPLATLINAMPGVSLDDIDVKAYPHAILPVTPRPCELLLRNNPDRAIALLASAGQYRLRLKSLRIQTRLEHSGDRHQTFYEEIMAALGYKHNQTPFRQLAKLLPVASLSSSRDTTLARFLGAARLLPQPDVVTDPAGQQMVRRLWDLWWQESGSILPDDVKWCLHNLRPQNTPVRRLAAAAALFSGICTIRHELDNITSSLPHQWYHHLHYLLSARCEWPFWQHRLTLGSPPETEATALLGSARIAAIITNVILPFAIAEARLPAGLELHLPPEDISAPMRLAAWHLFGRDHNPAIYSGNGLLQQGLLQIHQDFCLCAKPGCDNCELKLALGANQD